MSIKLYYWFVRFFWLACAAALLHAQPEFYQFQIDEDGLTGAADFSRLNTPLTARDRVFVRDGHFFRAGADLTPNTPDDERVDFFGTNLAFDGNLPAETDGPRIARRLRRLGFNLVRLHHLDTSPDSVPSNARSLLTTGPYPALNTVSVRRLRAFIDALKAEGIWINLNLHVGYEFRPAVDAIPAISPFPTQSKPLRMLHPLHPRMIELQLEYVRKLSEALQLKDDPALAMIEINNETSLIYHWQNGALDTLVTGEYRSELTRQWNEWLAGEF
jgi:hypothetical protein